MSTFENAIKKVLAAVMNAEYSHCRYPQIQYARIVKAVKRSTDYTYTLQLLNSNKQIKSEFPLIPDVACKAQFLPNETVLIVLVDGSLNNIEILKEV